VVDDGVGFGVVDGAACTIVVVAGLAYGADCDEVFFVWFEGEDIGRDVGGMIFGQGKGLREVRVPDEGDVVEVVEARDELVCLFDEEDVVEVLRFDGGAVADGEACRMFCDVRQVCQPGHIFL